MRVYATSVETCPICLMELGKDFSTFVPCGHVLCANCMGDFWARATQHGEGEVDVEVFPTTPRNNVFPTTPHNVYPTTPHNDVFPTTPLYRAYLQLPTAALALLAERLSPLEEESEVDEEAEAAAALALLAERLSPLEEESEVDEEAAAAAALALLTENPPPLEEQSEIEEVAALEEGGGVEDDEGAAAKAKTEKAKAEKVKATEENREAKRGEKRKAEDAQRDM